MSVFKCKMCGGSLEISPNQTIVTCEYCGAQQTLPKIDDEKKSNLYDRANHFRRNNEFDKAMSIYENILNEDSTDAEAYWSLVLCHYGIEYVEDPSTHKRVPTVNRAQFTSVFDDDNYKSALQYADSYQKAIYEQEAAAINEIQKGILAISQKEEPFDVFICYKETDSNGRRTQDSVLASDLYHQLTAEGFKVFFSRITLESKLGIAYEPYIFAALNSAKVMVVIGTKPEYFNAVWVKNEWSRFLALVKQSSGKKIVIPAYRDMDPYDLPEEFSHLQAQDMSKLGFMQDLIRGIKKLVNSEKVVVQSNNFQSVQNETNIENLLQRAQIFINDKEWQRADQYCEKILDLSPKCSKAYVLKLFIQQNVRSLDELAQSNTIISNNPDFQKAIKYSDEKERNKLLNCKNENIYLLSDRLMRKNNLNDLNQARKLLTCILGYKDSDSKQKSCCEQISVLLKQRSEYIEKNILNLKQNIDGNTASLEGNLNRIETLKQENNNLKIEYEKIRKTFDKAINNLSVKRIVIKIVVWIVFLSVTSYPIAQTISGSSSVIEAFLIVFSSLAPIVFLFYVVKFIIKRRFDIPNVKLKTSKKEKEIKSQSEDVEVKMTNINIQISTLLKQNEQISNNIKSFEQKLVNERRQSDKIKEISFAEMRGDYEVLSKNLVKDAQTHEATAQHTQSFKKSQKDFWDTFNDQFAAFGNMMK